MRSEVSVVLAGAAGQGIDTVAGILSAITKGSGFNVFVTKEFMSRIRGGTNSLQLRISSRRIGAYTKHTDIAVPLNESALTHLEQYGRLSKDTVIIGEKEFLGEKATTKYRGVHEVPFTEIAKEVGGKIYSNTVAAGVIAAFLGVDESVTQEYLKQRFASKGDEIVKNNLEAYDKGFRIGTDIAEKMTMDLKIETDVDIKGELLLSGTDAIAMGAIAGGCNFIASYPMSPSTGVLTFLSQQATAFGIVVDQAEDEIAAINKGIGAWYAGARAIITTSGGGFALMNEGVSLSGMLETPIVIHLAQRPGPATGLPTRTEQGDLNFALHSGHGEFPRIIYTPGTLDEAFRLAKKAFNDAAKYQVPVFLITDQFFLDSSYNTPKPSTDEPIEKHIVKTDSSYKRYKLTDNGISPRGVPGFGSGLVVADSDEHDEDGHITEDLNLRAVMVDKRLKSKLAVLRSATEAPSLEGADSNKHLVVCWGSNYFAVREALSRVESNPFTMMHFAQVYPLSGRVKEILQKADRVFAVETNAVGQFADLLQRDLGISIPMENRLLSYNGLPVPLESVVEFLESKR
jgi:2-oxoglutarate ferredoxin oxidoreductase subunit alpha